MADIQRYLNLVTSQHQNKPKFMAWLAAPLSVLDDGVTLLNNFNNHFDLDVAIGAQLNTLGDIVGTKRSVSFQPSDGSSPTLNDLTYRLILQTKIAQNQWDGTIPKIHDVWESILPDLGLRVVDHQDMSMTAMITGSINELRQQLIAKGYIVPKPSGVSVDYVSKTDMENKDTSTIVLSSASQAQNEMVHPPNPVTLERRYSTIVLSSASQAENQMTPLPDPITLDQKYNEMIISQAHTIVIQ